MAGVVENHAYRLTAYRAAIRAVARKVYLKPEDSGDDHQRGSESSKELLIRSRTSVPNFKFIDPSVV
jgi:hypothetical protein